MPCAHTPLNETRTHQRGWAWNLGQLTFVLCIVRATAVVSQNLPFPHGHPSENLRSEEAVKVRTACAETFGLYQVGVVVSVFVSLFL